MIFCYVLPVECLFQVSSNNQPVCWDFIYPGVAFPWWKYPGEIGLRAHLSLPSNFMGRSLSDTVRKTPLKTLCTP